MKKVIALALALICVLGLGGCQKTISASEVYSFPESTMLITGSFYSQGQESEFEIGSEDYNPDDLTTDSVIKWFYDLDLIVCDEPEVVEGSETYSFRVDGKYAFTYENRGSNEAYIITDKTYYKVSNPSTPPID